MDKELRSGLTIIGGIALAMGIFFLAVAAGTDDKAKCIADALRSKTDVAKIEKVCRLIK